MNCEERCFQYVVWGPEIEEIVSAIFHTIVFHRTLPALDFRDGTVSYNSYLGTRDVLCKNFELAYVCVNSVPLMEKVNNPIKTFANQLREKARQQSTSGEASGTITLEFAVHRKGTWNLSSEPSVWERWSVTFDLKPAKSMELEENRRQLEHKVRDDLFKVLEAITSPDAFTPSLCLTQAETEHIIDFVSPDISPYRFNIIHTTG